MNTMRHVLSIARRHAPTRLYSASSSSNRGFRSQSSSSRGGDLGKLPPKTPWLRAPRDLRDPAIVVKEELEHFWKSNVKRTYKNKEELTLHKQDTRIADAERTQRDFGMYNGDIEDETPRTRRGRGGA